MSGNKQKKTSISHRALDELVKFQTSIVTDIGQFKIEMIRSIKEIAEKHNEMATHLVAVEGLTKNAAAFAASEIGKMGGTVQHQLNIVGQATSAIDLNVLALAELTKEVVGQLTQVDAIFRKLHSTIKTILSNSYAALNPDNNVKMLTQNDFEAFDFALELAESEVTQVKSDALKWYNDMVASSFKSVQERLAKEDQERKEQEAVAVQIAKDAAEKQAAETETKNVEDELKKANLDELTIAAHTSGGSGSPFPAGADIFGG